MQIRSLHKNIYKLADYTLQQESRESTERLSFERQKVLKDWELLKSKGLSDRETASITGMSRATFYRRRKALELHGVSGLLKKSSRPKTKRQSAIPKAVIDQILSLRRSNPTYGKAKITILLKRDHGIILSESSVGRVLKSLLLAGKITKSISSGKAKRKRRFNAHAQSWTYDMRPSTPGEMVQIDHMTVTKHNVYMKHFQAWDPITKTIVASVASNATSTAAAKFLKKVIHDMPFPITSVQVDGGSEFMKDFEKTCKDLNISLYVLPPKRPQYNGGVERGNRTFREEFYARSDIQAENITTFQTELQKAVLKYNTYRPHFSLNGLTPLEYFNSQRFTGPSLLSQTL